MEEQNNLYSITGSEFSAIHLPVIKEVRGKDYMSFGQDNLFPQTLIDLYDNSAMHHTCVDAITEGILGEGLETIGDEYINSQGETIDDIFEKITLDYALFQGYALNIIWNKEGSSIAEIYHLPFANVRSGKRDEDDQVNEYMYSSNWTNLRKYPFETYSCFDATNNKGDNASQIYYCFNYTPGNEVYPLPSYVGALNDINLDHRISVFHNSNISNGLQISRVTLSFTITTPLVRTRLRVPHWSPGTAGPIRASSALGSRSSRTPLCILASMCSASITVDSLKFRLKLPTLYSV